MKTFIFPGQGSQERGMGGTLFDDFSELTQKADEILGYSIKDLCLDDANRQLSKTQFTQPAIYVVSAYCYFNRLGDNATKPDFVAGHSLGEFNALLAAECFDFETGLKLVKKRGELMSQASGGGMAAILGSNEAAIRRILQDNNFTDIELANFNTPSQIVVSGAKEQMDQASDIFNNADIKFIPLNTSGAFHSRLMQASKEEFEDYLNQFEFSNPQIPVISNVTAMPYDNDAIKANVANQMVSPVRWCESIQYLMAQNEMSFEEIGHGEVLSKLVSSIREQTSLQVPTADDQTTASIAVPIEGQGQSPWLDEIKSLSADEKVRLWNGRYPVGTRIKSHLVDKEGLETRTEAVVLFGHRSAVYLKDFGGYFDLDEVVPL